MVVPVSREIQAVSRVLETVTPRMAASVAKEAMAVPVVPVPAERVGVHTEF
jgi:hypothetical protein